MLVGRQEQWQLHGLSNHAYNAQKAQQATAGGVRLQQAPHRCLASEHAECFPQSFPQTLFKLAADFCLTAMCRYVGDKGGGAAAMPVESGDDLFCFLNFMSG